MKITFDTSIYNYAFGFSDRVVIDGIPHRPISSNETGYVMQLDDGSGRVGSFAHEQLSRLGSMGKIECQPRYYAPEDAEKRLLSSTTPLSALPLKQRQRLNRRQAYVEAFEELRAEGLIKFTDKSVRENKVLLMERASKYLNPHSPMKRSHSGQTLTIANCPQAKALFRWVRAYRKHGMEGLIDRASQRGNRCRLFGPEEEALIARGISRYASEERPTIKSVYDDVVAAFDERNEDRRERGLAPLMMPSKETIRRRVRALSEFYVAVRREGLSAARKQFAPVGQGLELHRPLERVEMDEWQIDLISLMASSGAFEQWTKEELAAIGLDGSKGRWFATVAICATTKCILGMKLSRNPKGSAAVQTLQMVLADKGEWAKAVDGSGPWDMHGVPEIIVTDNGSAFTSEEFRFACADLGIPAMRPPAGLPEMRAAIERLFGTISLQLLPRLSGRTFSNIVEKGDAEPENRAALTVDDLCFVLVRWVVDIYHNMPHQGLENGETPLKCWRRLAKEHGVQPPPSLAKSRLVFGHRLTRSLSKEGLRVLGVHYHSEQLAQWMLQKKKRDVEVRWHPRNIGAIVAQIGDEWVEVGAVDEGFDGVTAQTWLAARRALWERDPERRRYDRQVINEAIKAIDARNSAAQLSAGMLVEDWDADRIEREEKRLFIGFKIADSKKPTKVAGGVGRSIPDPEPQQIEAPQPSTNAAKPKRKANSRSAKATNWTVGD